MDTHEQLLTPASLPIPDGRDNNFWYLRPAASDVTIVFLHGIFSGSRSCWLFEGSPDHPRPVFWPDLIRGDTRLGAPAIYMGGYHTALDAGDFPLSQCAREVLDALQRPQQDGGAPVLDADALVFVCHSTGGIVARYLIERHKELFRKKAVGLALMASPSLGSNWANLGSAAAKYYNQRLMLQLRWNGEALEELHGRFKDLVDGRETQMPGLFGMEAAETTMIFRDAVPKIIRWALPNRLKVVQKLSAGQYFSEVVSLPRTDHFSIVKPYGVDHPAHDFLVTFMMRFRERLAELRQRGVIDRVRSEEGNVPPPASSAVRPVTLTVDSGQTRAGSTMSAVGAGTQIVINLPAPAPGPSVPSMLTGQDLQLSSLATHTSREAFEQASTRPRVDELFEIITDPDDVAKALYRVETGTGIAPYDTEYIAGRLEMTDTQEALETALREHKGRLLVTGRKGIGKTREVAQLARAACARKWKVLVARDEGNSRLGPPSDLPPGWADAQVLLVVDNLHSRVLASADSAVAPYGERLEQLLQWLERRLPGGVRVVTTARDETRFQSQLAVPRDATSWRGFGIAHLPLLSKDGLLRILTALAARVGVAVVAESSGLIEDSDRMPETMFINVDLARREGRPLTKEKWSPTEGESWRLRFVSARAERPAVAAVCQTVRVLNQAGLAARVRYVTAMTAEDGTSDAESAVHFLVDEGLLGIRQGVLMPFSADQLNEFLGDAAAPSPPTAFLQHADTIERMITDPGGRAADWADDLLALATALDRAGARDRAERVTSHAVSLDVGARAYRLRAALRFESGQLRPAEIDLTTAIDADGDDGNTRFLRGTLRNLLSDHAGAIDDLRAARAAGKDDTAVHAQLGTAYYYTTQWADAEKEFSGAIAGDQSAGHLYFVRGIARMNLKDVAGAETDFTAALERAVDFAAITRQIHALEQGAPSALSSAPSAPASVAGSAMIRLQRGLARLMLDRNAEAEADFAAAIESDVGAQLGAFVDQIQTSTLPILAGVKQQIDSTQVRLVDGALLHLRGIARLNQQRPAEAEADFDLAIAGGFVDPEVYRRRAWARFVQNNFAGAEADASTVLEAGASDGLMHSIRGIAYFELRRFEESERECSKAIDLGFANPHLYVTRANARTKQGKLAEAESDLGTALKDGPSQREQILFTRGCVRFDLGAYAGCEEDLTAALTLGFAPVALFSFRGLARLSLNNVQGAAEDADKAFAGGANDLASYSLRAGVRLEQARWAEAEQDLNTAAALGRADMWLHFGRGRARQALQRYEEAEQDYDVVVSMGAAQMGTSAPAVFFSRGNVRRAQKKAKQAAEDFAAAVAAGGDNEDTYLSLGMALQLLKRYPEAEAAFDKAVARGNSAVVRRARGMLRLVRADFRGAEADLTQVLVASPADAGLLDWRALTRLVQGNLTGSLADLDAALTLAPADTGHLVSRVQVALRRGDVEQAARDCAQLQAIEPEGATTHGAWGLLHLGRGEIDRAVEQFAAAARTDSSWNTRSRLASLIGGGADDVRQAYAEAAADSVPGDLALMIIELDFCSGSTSGLAMPHEARATVALIRDDLVRRMETLDPQSSIHLTGTQPGAVT